jgi:hypothetical protein
MAFLAGELASGQGCNGWAERDGRNGMRGRPGGPGPDQANMDNTRLHATLSSRYRLSIVSRPRFPHDGFHFFRLATVSANHHARCARTRELTTARLAVRLWATRVV